MAFIFITLFISHDEISGKEVNEEELLNKLFIFCTFFVFHFEISGKSVNILKFENK